MDYHRKLYENVLNGSVMAVFTNEIESVRLNNTSRVTGENLYG